jgi:hypothetical protein
MSESVAHSEDLTQQLAVKLAEELVEQAPLVVGVARVLTSPNPWAIGGV